MWRHPHLLRNFDYIRPTDMNVYDAAALSAVVDLSVQSTARRSRAIDFPDFTRGKWRANPKLQIDARLMAPTSDN